MIEVNLYKGPKGVKGDVINLTSIGRARFDKEAMGTSVEEFVIGFLKDEMEKFATDGRDISAILESNKYLGRQDLNCINNLLIENTGFRFEIYSVADDEINPNGLVSGETFEINIINHNHIIEDYPTCTKMTPSLPLDLPGTLRQIVNESDLYNEDKFAGINNPFSKYLGVLENDKRVGNVNESASSAIYRVLAEHGINVIWVSSED